STCAGTAARLCAVSCSAAAMAQAEPVIGARGQQISSDPVTTAVILHYAWSGPGGPFPDASCIDIPASALGTPGPLTYTVHVTDANGCTGDDTGTLTVLSKPCVAIRDTSTCQGVATRLCANQCGGTAALAHYTWHGPGEPFPDASCIDIPASVVGTIGPLTY